MTLDPDLARQLKETKQQIQETEVDLHKLTTQRDQLIIQALETRKTGPSHREIAEAVGLSREWIRRIEQRHQGARR